MTRFVAVSPSPAYLLQHSVVYLCGLLVQGIECAVCLVYYISFLCLALCVCVCFELRKPDMFVSDCNMHRTEGGPV